MKLYRAYILHNKRMIMIESEYRTKNDFIFDLRRNGYKVNPKRVIKVNK